MSNNKSRDSKGNRPFMEALSPLLTPEISKEIEKLDKKIVRIHSDSAQKIRNEFTSFKKEVLESLTALNRSNFEEKLSEIERRVEDSSFESISLELNKVKKEIAQLKKKCIPRLSVTINKNKPVDLGSTHCQFEDLLKIVSTGLHVFIVGPAGSGKTTAAEQCAKALGLEYYFTGAIASEFKLTGFINAQGQIVSTDFRKAYTDGGLFLFDEIDASFPQAVLAFNAALANNYMDFPDGRKDKHKNFRCIAAANTYGLGADRQYVGRNQLDAASIDRFIFLDWKYDEKLEKGIADNDNWVKYIHSVRRQIENNKIRHIVSPRASIYGAKLLKQGFKKSFVEELVLWKGLDKAEIDLIKENLG